MVRTCGNKWSGNLDAGQHFMQGSKIVKGSHGGVIALLSSALSCTMYTFFLLCLRQTVLLENRAKKKKRKSVLKIKSKEKQRWTSKYCMGWQWWIMKERAKMNKEEMGHFLHGPNPMSCYHPCWSFIAKDNYQQDRPTVSEIKNWHPVTAARASTAVRLHFHRGLWTFSPLINSLRFLQPKPDKPVK